MRSSFVAGLLLYATRLAAGCEDFHPAEQAELAIYEEYDTAVLHLKLGLQTIGTGYLIDAERGYILTAGHVADKAAGQSITAFAEPRPGKQWKLVLRKSLRACAPGDPACRPMDLALLQADPPDGFRDTRALDIALDPPKSGAKVYLMGYGVPDAVGATANISRKPATYSGKYNDARHTGYWRIEISGFGGDSGSPVIDIYGRVVATIGERVGASFVIAEALTDILATLMTLPPSPRVQALDERIRRTPHDAHLRDDLVHALRVKSTACTNLELLTWAGLMSRMGVDYTPAAGLMDCPILAALEERQLDDAVRLLRGRAPAAVVARAHSRLGDRAIALGRTEEAIEHFTIARTDLLDAITERAKKRPEGLSYALCRPELFAVSTGTTRVRLGTSEITAPTASCKDAQVDDALVYLFKDYALAEWKRGKIVGPDTPEGTKAFDNAIAGARLATWSSGEGKLRARTYADFAVILDDAKRPKAAAAAFATADDLGLGEARIGWTDIVRRTMGPTSALFRNGIKAAPELSTTDLAHSIHVASRYTSTSPSVY